MKIKQQQHASNKLINKAAHTDAGGGDHHEAAAAGGGGSTTFRKGPWTEQEDMKLVWFVRLFGERRWDFLTKVSGLNRTGKSCRLRWVNYLHPDLKRGRMTPDEERRVVDLHAAFGNRWSRIAKSMPGRTDNEIKNYWRTHMRKQRNNTTASSSTTTSAASTTNSNSTSSSTSMAAAAVASPEETCTSSSTSSSSNNNNNVDEAAPSQQEQLLYYTAAGAPGMVVAIDDQLLIWNDDMDWNSTGIAAAPSLMPSSPVWDDYCSASLWE